MSTGQRTTAALLLVCAVSGALGLTALRRALGYPEVLTAPAAGSLAAVREHGLSIGAGLVLSGIAAGLLVPITVGIVRLLPSGPQRPLLTVLASAAAAAQLTGLLFWLVSVPALARRAAIPAQADHASAVFDATRTLFGVMVGEVLACLLTASWSIALLAQAAHSGLLRHAPTRAALPRPAAVALAGWGGVAASGILGGVLLPFGVDAAVTGRVVGQLFWYLWLVGLAVAVWHLDPGGREGATNRTASRASPVAISEVEPVEAAPARSGAVRRRPRRHAAPTGIPAAADLPASDTTLASTASTTAATVAGPPIATGPTTATSPSAIPTSPTGAARGPTSSAGSTAPPGIAPQPGTAQDPPSDETRRRLDDAFFEATTEISWASRLRAGNGGRPLRAAAQPAGWLLGDDNPTDPMIDVAAPGTPPDRAATRQQVARSLPDTGSTANDYAPASADVPGEADPANHRRLDRDADGTDRRLNRSPPCSSPAPGPTGHPAHGTGEAAERTDSEIP
jgi:hypothetical protein